MAEEANHKEVMIPMAMVKASKGLIVNRSRGVGVTALVAQRYPSNCSVD